MTKIRGQCYNCQNFIEIEVQQTAIHDKLRWYISYDCPFCSSAIHIDDVNVPPENIRQKILIEEGEWEIVIETWEKQQQHIIKCLRQIFEVSTTELYQKFKELKVKPGAIYSGTKVEIDWLYSSLQMSGVESIIVQRKKNFRKFNSE
jgi:large subunit ribosomal protein L7/L12